MSADLRDSHGVTAVGTVLCTVGALALVCFTVANIQGLPRPASLLEPAGRLGSVILALLLRIAAIAAGVAVLRRQRSARTFVLLVLAIAAFGAAFDSIVFASMPADYGIARASQVGALLGQLALPVLLTVVSALALVVPARPHSRSTTAVSDATQLASLERHVRRLTIALVFLAAVVAGTFAWHIHSTSQVVSTSSLWANGFSLPRSPLHAHGYLGTSADDPNSVALVLSRGMDALGLPQSASQQIRMVLDEAGTQQLAFSDRTGKHRLRIQLDQDGAPSIVFLDPNGNTVWQAPPQP